MEARCIAVETKEKSFLDRLVRQNRSARHSVIDIFQEIQEKQGFLSEDAIRYVSEQLGIPASRAFAAATFYSAFSLKPRGRNRIHVCHGTACHIRGAENISVNIARQLEVQPGETTEDRRYSLHKVRCLGCCSLAPVVKINDDIHANTAQETLPKLLEKYR